jgi:hypothetical protein
MVVLEMLSEILERLQKIEERIEALAQEKKLTPPIEKKLTPPKRTAEEAAVEIAKEFPAIANTPGLVDRYVAYIGYRRSRRYSVSDAAIRGNYRSLTDLIAADVSPFAAIDFSERNGYQGLFREKSTNKPTGKKKIDWENYSQEGVGLDDIG